MATLVCLSGCKPQSSTASRQDVADSDTSIEKASVAEAQWNLIVISLDTLRADRLGCYGYSLPTSPFLDALSKRSILASDVLAQNPSTILSHRAIFTGQYVYQQAPGRAPDHRTLAGQLALAGYRTGAFTDGGLMHSQYGNDSGFEVYNDQAGGFKPVIDRGLAWIDSPDTRPFFLFLHTYDIHYPYTPSAPFDDMFLPSGVPPYHLGGDYGQEHWNSLDISREEFIWISRRYDGGVRATDLQMQRLWSRLQQRELLDRTLIVVLSDHGESLGERLYVGHRQLYDVQLQVPLIYHFQAVPEGFVLGGASETIDVFPTVLEMLRITPELPVSGRSMVSAVIGRKLWPDNRPRLSESWAKTFRVDSNWKMILRPEAMQDELYWLTEDVEEDNDVSRKYPERLEGLREELMKFTGLDQQSVRSGREQRQVPVMLRQKDDPGEENSLMDQLKQLGYLE